MDRLDSSLKELKASFSDRPFLTKEAADLLRKNNNYPKGTVYWILYELVNKNLLIRLGRGIYAFPDDPSLKSSNISLKARFTVSDKVTVEALSGNMSSAREKLNAKGIEFMFTGPSVLTRFHHYMSWRYIHLVYVSRGSGEYSVKTLRESGFTALLNPNKREVGTLLDSIEGKDLFIVREFSDLRGNVGGRASLERALVDTYFEATRRRIPYSEVEVGRILANAFREENIDITHFLKLAERRGIRAELEIIVKAILPSYPLPSWSMVKHVEKVLQGIRE
ncbi:MAG: DUF6577 family protein [Candidatus Bathyarchaeota archaeon]